MFDSVFDTATDTADLLEMMMARAAAHGMDFIKYTEQYIQYLREHEANENVKT